MKDGRGAPVSDKSIAFREDLFEILFEDIIVFSRHQDVDIIVPRDNTFLPYCTEQCSAVSEIGDPESLTGLVHDI